MAPAFRALIGGLPRWFALGAGGFVGALAWLAVPAGLWILAPRLPEGPDALAVLAGGLGLGWIAPKLPYLQARFALERSWPALWDVRAVTRRFRRAPFAFVAGLAVTLAGSFPLFLLKIELAPREVAWLACVFFVVFAFPARLATGWALRRAEVREADASFAWRWIMRGGAAALGVFYAFTLYFTQFLSWRGAWSFLEQHAFLTPAPWLGF